MVIEEMTETECRAMLGGPHIARLACALNDQPYIVPVRVAVDGEFLYGIATLGQKIEWMRLNPLVCLEIDDVATDERWTSVVVFGRYEELPHTPDYEDLRRVAQRLFERRPLWWEPASVPLKSHDLRPRVVFRILMARVTGRRAVPCPERSSLSVVHASRHP